MADTPRDLDRMTRRQLYELAREHDLAGRSSLSKSELLEALRRVVGEADDGPPDAARYEAFAAVARARGRGEVVPSPRSLTGEDRRLHVRQTLREDHRQRIGRDAQDAHVKFDELAGSLFSFFRGTCLLFYRDLAGDDAWMPTVLTLGDVHPENFGVMPNRDNTPIFGVNDFDEAYYAPFTWDLKRGAVGFTIAAEVEGDLGRKQQRKIIRRFVEGYLDGIERFAHRRGEREAEVRLDNAPPLIAELIEDALQDRREWLAEDYHEEFGRGFRADDELLPVSSRRDEFQELIDRYVRENGIEVPPRAGRMRVKDVAIRRGAGTASLGLDRYYVLIEGPNADASDDLLLELKQARRSALSGLVASNGIDLDGRSERIAHAQTVQLVRGDSFYGSIEFEGQSFMGRERAPYRDDIDLDDLSKKQWRAYAETCGRTLAHAHALSDEAGLVDHDIEPAILAAVGERELFVDDVLRFALESAARVRRDHAAFKADHALGAFESIDRVYR